MQKFFVDADNADAGAVTFEDAGHPGSAGHSFVLTVDQVVLDQRRHFVDAGVMRNGIDLDVFGRSKLALRPERVKKGYLPGCLGTGPFMTVKKYVRGQVRRPGGRIIAPARRDEGFNDVNNRRSGGGLLDGRLRGAAGIFGRPRSDGGATEADPAGEKEGPSTSRAAMGPAWKIWHGCHLAAFHLTIC